MSSRPLPPLLEPYLRLPPETSLILLTSTLSSTANWLVARFITAISTKKAKASSSISTADDDFSGTQDSNSDPLLPPPIVLVSWQHSEQFFRSEVKRAGGGGGGATASTSSRQQPKFTFVDFSTSTSITLSSTEESLTSTLQTLKQKPLLILSSPDILLATSSTTTSTHLNALILRLRSLSHSLIVSCSADLPIISASSVMGSTPMELECANFVTMQAHAARFVMGVRELETGAARDVSGVMSVTRGGGWYGFDSDEDGEEVEEAEMLYLVQRDGNVKVFGRGSGVD